MFCRPPAIVKNAFDKLTVHTRSLAALGISMKENGSLLISVIMTKLPNDVRLRIARDSKGEVWKLETILETIRVEVEAREASSLNKATVLKSHAPPKPPTTSSALFSGSQVPKYVYCEGEHYYSSCQVVKDIRERRAILMRGGRCFVRLKPQHRAKDCDPNRNCRKCHKRHHQSLCDNSIS